MYYKVNENIKRNAPWPPECLNGVAEAVCSEKARLWGGVFERPSQQAAELGRICGVVVPSPFAQVFTETPLTKTK